MASFDLAGPPAFPNGTSVKAYPLSNWNGAQYAGSAPVGSEDATATVSSGTAAFTGLDPNTRYVAYAQVSSQHRYVRFSTLTSAVAAAFVVLTQAEYDELDPDPNTLYVISG